MAGHDSEMVLFQPLGRRVRAQAGKSVLELAQEAGVELESACGGKGICGACRIRVEGSAPEPSAREEEYLDPAELAAGWRLACQTRVRPGAVVWVPPQSSRHQQVILTTTASGPGMDLDPPPQALAAAGEGPCLGLAVDLGTTTVVALLHDLREGRLLAAAAEMNPQVAQGEDVISRISYCESRPDGLAQLSGLARRCIRDLARAACRQAGTRPEHIFAATVVGNTAMHHILLGLPPGDLARPPYQPVKGGAIEVAAGEMELGLAPGARVYLPPVKAGFVGADAVAASLAGDLDRVEVPTLLVDLGTNGELVLATPRATLCCSTAAGPAFEGGQVRWGMRAAPGAVEGMDLAAGPEKPRLAVIGEVAPLGICGSGLVSAVAALLGAGGLEPHGGFVSPVLGSRLRPGGQGREYLLALAEQTGTGQDLVITHRDISQLQMAKGAIYAGAKLMLDQLGLARVERVLLAGAFGNYLDPADLCAIGLLPGVVPEMITSLGNAAGTGAAMLLLSVSQRDRAQDLARRMRYLELAAHPAFQDAYLEGMMFAG